MSGTKEPGAPAETDREIEIPEMRSVDREGPVPHAPGSSRHSQLLVAGLVGMAAILAAAAALIPLALPRAGDASPSTSSSLSADTSGQPSATTVASTTRPSMTAAMPTETPDAIPTDAPTPTFKPIAVNGWPVKWQYSDSGPGWLAMGPDGTVFLSTNPLGTGGAVTGFTVAIDQHGHQRAGWLRLPDGKTFAPTATGSDGTMYVTEAGDGKPVYVYAFSPEGSLKTGWPVELPGADPILPGPSGTLYTTSNGALVVLGPDGKVEARGDSAPDDLCGLDNAVIRPDGMLFVLCRADSSPTMGRVAVFGSDGKKLAGASTALWSGIETGPHGTVLVWRNETDALAAGGFAARDTEFAVIGADEQPLAGWSKSVGGPASIPVVGSDGSVYVVIEESEREAPSQIIAFDADGTIKWVHSLPDGTAPEGAAPRMDGTGQPGVPLYPVPPVLGRDGTVYFVVDDAQGVESVIALDSSGRTLPGWPVSLPRRIQTSIVGACIDWCGPSFDKPLFVQPASGPALLYLHLNDTILALTEDGKVASGWPKRLAAGDSVFYGWSWWAATPDGGLVTLEERQLAGDTSYVLTRWNSDGSIAH